MRRWVAVVLACFAACEVADAALSQLGEGCILDSDCDGELVCVYQRCHQACRESVDCPAGERCVRGGSRGAICQLEDESRCALHSDCHEPQICGPDGRCRDQCRADDDCVSGQLCVTGVCADPEELQDGRLPSQENELGEGKPCVVHSHCPDDLLCIEGKCLYECQTSYDCPSGECEGHHCIPLAPPKAPCAPGQQVSCRCSPGVPGVHICNDDGLAYGDCICQQGAGGMGGTGMGGTGMGGTGMGGTGMGGTGGGIAGVGGGIAGMGGMGGMGGLGPTSSSSGTGGAPSTGGASSSSNVSGTGAFPSVGGGASSSNVSGTGAFPSVGGGASSSNVSGSGGLGTGAMDTAGAASTEQ